MSVFWLGVALLSIIAIVIIGLPWILRDKNGNQDSLTNVQIIKQRIQELEYEAEKGLISDADQKTAIDELKLALLDETQSASVASQSSHRGLTSLFAILAIGLGIGVYGFSNEIASIVHWKTATDNTQSLAQRIVLEGDPSVTAQDIEDFALAMRTRLLDKPDDAVGWLLLGRLHASANRLETAIEAFEKALQLDPNHLGTLSSYSQALLMTGEESSVRKAQRLLLRSVEIDPTDVNSMGMLAVTASQLGETEQAVSYWQQVRSMLPDSDPMLAEIDKRIETLKSGQTGETSVVITVSLAPELQAKLPENAFLFVFAQDPTGQVKMPAAVVKSRLAELPVTVMLSDANAMLPSYKLSQLKEAKLVARISLDENVAQAPGELQGDTVIAVEVGNQLVQDIMIDKELK